MDRTGRVALRAALLEAAPWLDDGDHGPRTVDAGTCDRCGRRPRLVATCGPGVPGALCGHCLVEFGDDAWCDGHAEAGERARDFVNGLPEHYENAVVLWWVSTGEVRLDAWPGGVGDDVGASLGIEVLHALQAAGVNGAPGP